ncbi:MAG: hypothetical protein K9L32_12765 [Chromatiaceae bacterium]|nr:hypothetical protein [Chromatiaceae bacterium]
MKQSVICAVKAAAEPHNLADHQIDEIAATAWQRLTQALACEMVYIPAPSKAQRNAAIIAAWRAGETLAAIAAKHRLTSARIRQITAASGDRHDRS